MIDGMNQFPAQTYFYQRDIIEMGRLSTNKPIMAGFIPLVPLNSQVANWWSIPCTERNKNPRRFLRPRSYGGFVKWGFAKSPWMIFGVPPRLRKLLCFCLFKALSTGDSQRSVTWPVGGIVGSCACILRPGRDGWHASGQRSIVIICK